MARCARPISELAVVVVLGSACERPDTSSTAPPAESHVSSVVSSSSPVTTPPAPARGAEPESAPKVAPPALPAAPTSGPASERCIQGWTSPGPGDPLRQAALDMIRHRKDVRFVVDEIRYFLGPEDQETTAPVRTVERWYVKVHEQGHPENGRRWLIRRTQVGQGAVWAPYHSTGYAPKTWEGNNEMLGEHDPFENSCFTAPAGSDCYGLPRAVVGCLDGT